jgi:hypothetical protein
MTTLIWHLMCYNYHVMSCVVCFNWFLFYCFYVSSTYIHGRSRMVSIWSMMLMVNLLAYHFCFLVLHGVVALICYGGLVVNGT